MARPRLVFVSWRDRSRFESIPGKRENAVKETVGVLRHQNDSITQIAITWPAQQSASPVSDVVEIPTNDILAMNVVKVVRDVTTEMVDSRAMHSTKKQETEIA